MGTNLTSSSLRNPLNTFRFKQANWPRRAAREPPGEGKARSAHQPRQAPAAVGQRHAAAEAQRLQTDREATEQYGQLQAWACPDNC